MAAGGAPVTYQVDLDNEGLLKAAAQTEKAGEKIGTSMGRADEVMVAMVVTTEATIAAIDRLTAAMTPVPAKTKKVEQWTPKQM